LKKKKKKIQFKIWWDWNRCCLVLVCNCWYCALLYIIH